MTDIAHFLSSHYLRFNTASNMKPFSVLLLLIFFASPYASAQNWMERDISQRVVEWLQVPNGDLKPNICAFDADDLTTGVYGMTFTPITLPGCNGDTFYHVVVHPGEIIHPDGWASLLGCNNAPYLMVPLVVAIISPKSTALIDGELRTVIGEPQIAVISGPIFTDSESDWRSSSITPLERAQARLYYLDVEDLRPGRTTGAYSAFRAYSQAMKAQVEIRFDPADRDRFAIYTLGRDARCIKSWDDAAEEE